MLVKPSIIFIFSMLVLNDSSIEHKMKKWIVVKGEQTKIINIKSNYILEIQAFSYAVTAKTVDTEVLVTIDNDKCVKALAEIPEHKNKEGRVIRSIFFITHKTGEANINIKLISNKNILKENIYKIKVE